LSRARHKIFPGRPASTEVDCNWLVFQHVRNAGQHPGRARDLPSLETRPRALARDVQNPVVVRLAVKTQGYSLIEVMVAMALVLLLLLGTAELVTLSIWAKRKGDVTAGLCRAVEARAESLKSLSFEADGLQPGEYSETVRDEAGGGLFLHEWTIEDPGGRAQRIRLTVTPAGRAASAAALTLWISKDLGFPP
jgi:prepilin-type N-terminal cleavage/methylation domain-containing protein